jgi:MFS superfamily sulfate permease-like transporter
MSASTDSQTPPSASYPAVLQHLSHDIVAGFFVFLIALPLCVGISLASGCPATAGVLTAIVGGILTPFLSNSELTIKGPAAGMIAIVLGAVTAFTPENPGDAAAAAFEGYQRMLGLAVVAGGLQALLGGLRLGGLGEFFPLPAVQGMLVAIGMVIISKQSHVLLLGSAKRGGAFELLAAIPASIQSLSWPSGIIGLSGLAFLGVYRSIRLRFIQAAPAPLWLLLLGVVAAVCLGVPETQLVRLPSGTTSLFTAPDFSGVATVEGLKWILLLAIVGSLESVLSAKAVDLLDPWKRRTDLNRDLLAVGVANMLGALAGALPMISEIVRSSASAGYGARTRWANFFHALFLLLVVSLAPGLLRHIPLSALAAMLVFAGFQLAAPSKFVLMYKTGRGEFLVFLTTVVATLLTDLLAGICAGVLMQWLLLARVLRSNPFTARCQLQREQDFIRVKLEGPLIFSNWLSFARGIDQSAFRLVLDVTAASVVDHSALRKLREIQVAWEHEGRVLLIEGLEALSPASDNSFATRTAPTVWGPAGRPQKHCQVRSQFDDSKGGSGTFTA